MEFCEHGELDFFIWHIGDNDKSCLHFIRLLEQEGYHCDSNIITDPKECRRSLLSVVPNKLYQKSRNYIIWISSEKERDNDMIESIDGWNRYFVLNLHWIAFETHGYFLPYIFRLNNCPVPESLEKYKKYETYELSTDFPYKMAEILEYLKRSPTKEHSVDYIHETMYTYDVYVVEYESGRLDVLDNFLKVFESYQYRVYNSCSDQLPGDIITNSVISTVRKSRSLFVLFDKSFFKNRTAMFEVEEGKQIKHGNQNFKLIVVELTPIPSEYLSYFELFSRITIQNNYEDRAYQHISRIITETDLTEEEIQVENCRLKNLNEQIAIAREVNMLPPQKLLSECRKGIHLYKRLVETTSEEVYYIRVVVLGQEGVGKTTLVRRLLKENISQVESTNGIEINVDKCGISLHNGKWEFKKDLFSTNGNAILLRKLTEMKEYKPLRNEITNEKMEKEKKVVSRFRNFERSVRSFVESENERVKNEAWKQSLQNLTVKNSFDYGKTAIMSVWDFAGQQEFYPTHQLFLSRNCIVLLVSDISKRLHQKGSQETVLYERNQNRKQAQILSDVNDYVQYWTNTVHCYGDVSRNEDNLLNPPIIPVATHIDSIQHSNAEDYIDEYQEALIKSLGSDRRKDHFRNFFAISNTQSSEAEIEKLRQYIFAIAKQQEHWGVKVPVKWIPFWNKIEELRLEGKSVVTVNDLLGINKSLPSPLATKKEVISFLVLHHDIGNIIFFEDIGESVIICPQWFANALRCVVGAKCFKAPSLRIDWEQYEKTGFLQKKLIEHLFKETDSSLSEFKEHIFNVMGKFDILVCADILEQEYDMYNNGFNYLVPCMVRTSGWQILSNKFINFTKSAIICFEYDFLPSMFFYHVVVYFLRRFILTSDSDNPSGYVGELYRDVALFDIDDTGCEKVLLCSHKNSIQAQIWIWGIGMQNTGRMIRGLLEDDMFVIQRKYDVMKAVEIKIKCPESTLISNKGGINLESLRPVREYWCKEHNIIHDCLLFKQYWMLNVIVDDTVSEEEQNFIRVSKASVEVLTDMLYDLANASACPIIKLRNECDITYLYGELRRQGLFLPSRGRWGGDNWPCERVAVNVGDDIERIRLNRNRLQHTSHFEMSIFEFTDRWKKLNALAKRFDARLTPAVFYEDRLIRLNHYLGRKLDFQNFQTKESKGTSNLQLKQIKAFAFAK